MDSAYHRRRVGMKAAGRIRVEISGYRYWSLEPFAFEIFVSTCICLSLRDIGMEVLLPKCSRWGVSVEKLECYRVWSVELRVRLS